MDLSRAHASTRSTCSGLKRALVGALRMKLEAGVSHSKTRADCTWRDLPTRSLQFREFSSVSKKYKKDATPGLTRQCAIANRQCWTSACSNSVWSVIRAFNSCRQWCLNISDNEKPTSSFKPRSFLPHLLAVTEHLERLVSRFKHQSALSEAHRDRRLHRKPPYFRNQDQLKNEQPPLRASSEFKRQLIFFKQSLGLNQTCLPFHGMQQQRGAHRGSN